MSRDGQGGKIKSIKNKLPWGGDCPRKGSDGSRSPLSTRCWASQETLNTLSMEHDNHQLRKNRAKCSSDEIGWRIASQYRPVRTNNCIHTGARSCARFWGACIENIFFTLNSYSQRMGSEDAHGWRQHTVVRGGNSQKRPQRNSTSPQASQTGKRKWPNSEAWEKNMTLGNAKQLDQVIKEVEEGQIDH